MADAGKFFARWSQLKRQTRKSLTGNASEEATTPAVIPDTPPVTLPSVASLTAESDYTLFMRPGVPEVTRNAALQKLWRSDPVFANLDGLVEYGEDYAAAFKVSATVHTAYRIAQGMGETVPAADATERTPLPQKNDLAPAAPPPTHSEFEASPTSPTKDGSDMQKVRGSARRTHLVVLD